MQLGLSQPGDQLAAPAFYRCNKQKRRITREILQVNGEPVDCALDPTTLKPEDEVRLKKDTTVRTVKGWLDEEWRPAEQCHLPQTTLRFVPGSGVVHRDTVICANIGPFCKMGDLNEDELDEQNQPKTHMVQYIYHEGKRGRNTEFEIGWLGWEDCTWEPEANVPRELVQLCRGLDTKVPMLEDWEWGNAEPCECCDLPMTGKT